MLNARKHPGERLAFISFDDGWRDNLKLLPTIEKYQVPICIFAATEPLKSGNFWWEYVREDVGTIGMIKFKELPYDKFYSQLAEIKSRHKLERSALTTEELAKLSQHPLVTIQSHTVNHPILTHVPDKVLNTELHNSKLELEKITGNKEVYAISYPNGSLNKREVTACRQYYKMAFTTEQRDIKITDDLHLLPRYALTGNSYFRDLLKAYGVWKNLKKIKIWR
jgi:peptidoglycan/xylan/chitin deacetylase (PgdA/CDA1 family)